MVRLDAGPTVVAHLHGGCAAAPCRVRVGARLDKAGQGVLVAFPIDEVPNMADDPELREMTCDPKFRKVLVTDGKTAGRPGVVRALVDAGADLVWVGLRRALEAGTRDLQELEALPQVTLLPLDLTDSRSVKQMAAKSAARSTSWSTPPSCTARMASPREAA